MSEHAPSALPSSAADAAADDFAVTSAVPAAAAAAPSAAPFLTPAQTDALGTAARRMLAIADSESLSSASPVWHDLADSVRRAAGSGLITAAAAREEREAVEAFARAAPAIVSSAAAAAFFFAEPRLRFLLRALSALPPPGDLFPEPREDSVRPVFARPPSAPLSPDAESADVWLDRASAPDSPPSGPPGSRHLAVTAEHIFRLTNRLRGAADPMDVIDDPAGIIARRDLAAALIAEATWATGLRPAEWTDAEVQIEREGARRPLDALLRAAFKAQPRPEGAFERRVLLRETLARLIDSGPMWISARSRKSRFLRRAGLPERRSIGLHDYPAATRVSVFCAAMAVRAAARSGTGWEKFSSRIYHRLVRIGEEFADSGLPLTPPDRTFSLYVLRHDFIERCKASLDPEACCALFGHASPDSKQSYGRPRMTGKRSGGHVPKPDAGEAAAFAHHLERRRAARTARIAAARKRDTGSAPPDRPRRPSPAPAPSPSPR